MVVKPIRLFTIMWTDPTNRVTLDSGHVQSFGQDAQSGEGGVTVHDDWNDQAMPRFAATPLLARVRPIATGSTASR